MRKISKSFRDGISLKRVMPSLMHYLIKNKYSVLFIFAFAILLFGAIKTDSILRVKNVIVNGDIFTAPFKGVEQIKGTFIWRINKDTIEAIRQLNPSYTVESVEKTYPFTITINVYKQVPGAYLAVDDGYLLLSTESVILEKTREEPHDSYPIIAFYQHIPFSTYSVGQAIDADEIEDSLFFLALVKQTIKERVDSIDIVSYNMLGLYTSNKTFFFTSEKERETQQWQLEQAVKQFRIDGTAYTVLDLRFDKPVVKF